MKSKVFIVALCMGIVIIGCQKDNSEMTPTANKSNPGQNEIQPSANADLHPETRYSTWTGGHATNTTDSRFISILDADAMIGSYLYSIHADRNDSDVRSYSVDADMLRAYLADSSVKNVKLIFAHTLDYIKEGHIGQNAGYKASAMTIIIAAYDDKGNYVYHNGMVLDHMMPCPTSCPPGIAGSELLY